MTKQLAPIEELAKQCNADIGTWDKSGNGGLLLSFTKDDLITFRQAIIKDFVSKAEVKAALIDDPLHLNGITKDDAAMNYYSKRGKATKLYALPDWIEK